MSKTKSELLEENRTLKNEIIFLKDKFKENTIIESMNDMKKRYDQLQAHSVCRCRYIESKMDNLHLKKICNTSERLTELAYRKVNEIMNTNSELKTKSMYHMELIRSYMRSNLDVLNSELDKDLYHESDIECECEYEEDFEV